MNVPTINARPVALGAALMALLAPALGLTACGGSDPQEAVRGTVRDYLAAIADADGDKACDQLSGDARRGLVDSVRAQVPELNVTTCQDAIEQLSANMGADEASALRDVEFDHVTVTGDTATASLVGGTSDAELIRSGDTWLIDGGIS